MKTVWLAALLLIAAGPAVAQTNRDGPVEVPLRMIGGRLVVPLQGPNGTELQFSLSLGTGQTALSESTSGGIALRERFPPGVLDRVLSFGRGLLQEDNQPCHHSNSRKGG